MSGSGVFFESYLLKIWY